MSTWDLSHLIVIKHIPIVKKNDLANHLDFKMSTWT